MANSHCTTTSAPHSADTIEWCRRAADGAAGGYRAQRSAHRWGNLTPSDEAKNATVPQTGTNVLPLPSEGGGKITVVNSSQGSPASRRRRSPAVLCSFLIVVALPLLLA